MIRFKTGKEKIAHAFLHGLHQIKSNTTPWLAACGKEMHWVDSPNKKSKRKLRFFIFGPNRIHQFWPKLRRKVDCERCQRVIDKWLKDHEPVVTDGLKRRMLMQKCLQYLQDGVPDKKNTRYRKALSRHGLLPVYTHCVRVGCEREIPKKKGKGRRRKTCSNECARIVSDVQAKEALKKHKQRMRGEIPTDELRE